jgi:hypothetical protein
LWYRQLGKDGPVVKARRYLMASTPYAIMSLRHARTETQCRNFNRAAKRKEAP